MFSVAEKLLSSLAEIGYRHDEGSKRTHKNEDFFALSSKEIRLYKAKGRFHL
jgi:hypothetical protein